MIKLILLIGTQTISTNMFSQTSKTFWQSRTVPEALTVCGSIAPSASMAAKAVVTSFCRRFVEFSSGYSGDADSQWSVLSRFGAPLPCIAASVSTPFTSRNVWGPTSVVTWVLCVKHADSVSAEYGSTNPDKEILSVGALIKIPVWLLCPVNQKLYTSSFQMSCCTQLIAVDHVLTWGGYVNILLFRVSLCVFY